MNTINELWTILQPIVLLLVSTVGPILVTWIATRLAAVLQITEDDKRVALEKQLRDALHQSAENAIKLIIGKAVASGSDTIAGSLSGIANDSRALNQIVNYVKTKNPDAVATLGVDEKAILDIALSKIPNVLGSLSRHGS